MARKPEPKPVHLRVIESDAKDDGTEGAAPEIATVAPLPIPDELLAIDGADHAVRAWREVNNWLSQRRLLQEVDRFKLFFLCAAIGRWHWVQDQVRAREREGADTPWINKGSGRYYTVNGRSGKQHKTHPLVHDEREALKQINTLGSDFGLDPVARLRLLYGATAPEDGDLFDGV